MTRHGKLCWGLLTAEGGATSLRNPGSIRSARDPIDHVPAPFESMQIDDDNASTTGTSGTKIMRPPVALCTSAPLHPL